MKYTVIPTKTIEVEPYMRELFPQDARCIAQTVLQSAMGWWTRATQSEVLVPTDEPDTFTPTLYGILEVGPTKDGPWKVVPPGMDQSTYARIVASMDKT